MPQRNRSVKGFAAPAPNGRLALDVLRLRGASILLVCADARQAAAVAAIARALAPESRAAHFPPLDSPPYDPLPASRACVGGRMAVLGALACEEAPPRLVTACPAALLRRVPPRAIWPAARLALATGETPDADALADALARIGYRSAARVEEPGDFALRPHTIEIFPAAAAIPARLALEEGRIVEIRGFDPDSQRDRDETRERLVVDPACEIVRPAGEVPAAHREEHRLAAHYEALETLLDYLPDARILVRDGTEEAVEDALGTIAEAHAYEVAIREARGRGAHPLPPERLFLGEADWRALAEEAEPAPTGGGEGEASVPRFWEAARPLAALRGFVEGARDDGLRILATGTGRAGASLARRLAAALGQHPLPVARLAEAAAAEPGALLALPAPLEAGFVDAADEVAAIAPADLLGPRAVLADATRDPLGLDEAALAFGEAAIHAEHGIGIVEGLVRVDLDGEPREALRLAYADGASLMVPVDELDRVSRYGAAVEGLRLDRLDGDTWARRRDAIEAEIAEGAARLEAAAKARARRAAPAIAPPARAFARIASRFPHAPTADQERALAEILEDLGHERPMQRLLCGDVGSGKTEVAVRAIAATALAGKQAALVAPTTILAQQHYDLLCRRFAGTGIAIGRLSRLVGTQEARRTRAGLRDGTVRIVVGTHALGAKDVRFSDLGLVVIDEEQRFGARQKASLARLSEGTHALSLSATPIPGTLAAALAGLVPVSVIAEPPPGRHPVRTLLAEDDDAIVREALLAEHARGGLSFVVAPRIADLAPLAQRIARAVPELTLAVAHGRMKPAEVEETMLAFAEGEGADVLVATNIVESGLDVRRADTILITSPDRFGLADLHQLRGRVGRGPRRAHAFLLVERERRMAAATRARLETLARESRLGAGFAIGLADLFARGAGSVLGDAQSGHVAALGLGLYRRLVARAAAIAQGRAPEPETLPRIEIGLHGAIPEDFVAEPALRLELHARLARIADDAALDDLEDEIAERFGEPPEPVSDLLALARLRLACAEQGIVRLEGGPQALAASFDEAAARRLAHAGPPPEPLAWRGDRLVYEVESEDGREREGLAEDFLEAIGRLAESEAGGS